MDVPLSEIARLQQEVSNLRRDLSALFTQAKLRDRLYTEYITALMTRLGYSEGVIETELRTLISNSYIKTDYGNNNNDNSSGTGTLPPR